MPFTFEQLSIPGVALIEPRVFDDERGFFFESYKRSEFSQAGINERFVQDNHSRSMRGVLRGLHFQLDERAQGKLVECVVGSIFDVVVDLRHGSPAFGRWLGLELSEENHKLLYVPPGLAHGFMTLSESADIIYKCTDEYSPEHDAGIIWNDPDIGVKWPEGRKLLSEKDRALPTLKNSVISFRYK